MISNPMQAMFRKAEISQVQVSDPDPIEPVRESVVTEVIEAPTPIKYIRPSDLANTPQPYRRGPLFQQTMESRIKSRLGVR